MRPRTLIRSLLSFALIALVLIAFAGCGQRPKVDVSADKEKPVKDKDTQPANKDGVKERAVGLEGKHALLVGVTEYDNQALGSLQYTENDVEVLAEALKKPEADFVSVRVLTVSRGKQNAADKPTAANVKKAIDALLAKRTKRDTVLIALAGHGVTLEVKGPKDEDVPKTYPFFCPSDADLFGVSYSTGQSGTLINLDDLFTDLGRSGAGTKLVLMDACRNQLTVKAGRRSLDPGGVRIPRNVAALYSCGQGQFAHETPNLGKGHGVFFHFVAEGLKGAAKDNDGVVTWASLSEYATKQVIRKVGTIIGDGARQTPAAMGSLEGESPVLVLAKGKPAPVVGDEDKDKDKPKDGTVVVGKDKDTGKIDKDKPAKEKDKDKPVVKQKPQEIKNSIGMRLVLIRAGKFKMGSPDEEKGREGDERQHEVEISKPFHMGVFEVTQEQWVTVMGKDSNPSHWSMTGGGAGVVKGIETDDFPVDAVSWDQAVEFCKKLSALKAEKAAGRTYRLPTEAEWEYACRAGTDTVYHYGDSISTKTVNMGYDSSSPGYLGRTCKVGSYKPNDFGLYDMHGNAAEWVADWYDQRYYRTGPAKDPPGPEEGTRRVLRGGSYRYSPEFCRSATRQHEAPAAIVDQFGFRVVCEIKK